MGLVCADLRNCGYELSRLAGMDVNQVRQGGDGGAEGGMLSPAEKFDKIHTPLAH